MISGVNMQLGCWMLVLYLQFLLSLLKLKGDREKQMEGSITWKSIKHHEGSRPNIKKIYSFKKFHINNSFDNGLTISLILSPFLWYLLYV